MILWICTRNGRSQRDRFEFLKKAARIDGIYVPCFYEVEYNEDGTVKAHKVKEEYKDYAKEKVVKRVVRILKVHIFLANWWFHM